MNKRKKLRGMLNKLQRSKVGAGAASMEEWLQCCPFVDFHSSS